MRQGTMILVAVPSAPSLKFFTPQEWLDYYNMVDKNTDSENGVSINQIIRVGEMIESGIEADTNTRFDNNSGSFYSSSDMDDGEDPEYHDATFSHKNFYMLKFPPINNLITFEVNITSEGRLRQWRDLVFNQIDALDATTGWSATTDGSVSLNTTPASVNEGSGALNLIKSGATVAAVTYSKTFSSSLKFTDREVKVDYFISDSTDLASSDAIELRYGISSSAYYSQKFDRNQINSNAYTTLGFRRDDTDVTTTGSPDPDTLNYFAIVVTAVSSGTTISAGDQRLDDIRINERDRINLDSKTGRVRITDPVDNPEEGARHARVNYNFGRSTVPNDIKQLAIIETGKHMIGSAFMRARINDKTDAVLGDLTAFDAFRTRVIRKYKNQPFLPS